MSLPFIRVFLLKIDLIIFDVVSSQYLSGQQTRKGLIMKIVSKESASLDY